MFETCRTHPRLTRNALPALLVALLAGCGGSGGGPRLQALTLGDGPTYTIVGQPQQLTATGTYSDGRKAQVQTGLTWSSSDPAVVSVDATGQLIPWGAGQVRITSTDEQTGVSATADIVSRVVGALTWGDTLPASGRVDTGAAYFRVSGLAPGTMYTPALSNLSDDVDLAVFSDISMTDQVQLCHSAMVGHVDERCTAPANQAGELWIAVDGQWTQSGASFAIDLPATQPVTLASTLAFPAAFPYAGVVGATKKFVKVTGLAAGTTYEVRISGLAADLDLEAYQDAYEYRSVCESFLSGTVDDFCDATPNAAGELIIEIDGQTSPAGSVFTLAITAR